MRALPAAFAALALFALATPAAAEPPPPPVAQAPVGLSPAAVAAWIASKGGVVSEVQRSGGETWITVQDGGMNWLVFFYGCQNDVCGDIQLAASFTNPTITPEMINAWNREHRFLKAFHEPGETAGEGVAIVQYDVLLTDAGPDQLADPIVVWLNLLEAFAVHVGYLQAPAQ